MKQLFINAKGQVDLLELPEPRAGNHQFVVKTHYSVISPGTELAMIRSARQKTLIQKIFTREFAAKVREKYEQDELLESIQEKLPFSPQTNALVELRPIGYSAAGVIRDISPEMSITNLVPGTAVACAGTGHGDACATGPLMVAEIPPNVELKTAAFATLGSIAIQGIRRGDVVAGQTVVVMGLGILGQLTAQILEQIGVRVILVDPNATRLELAEHCLIAGVALPVNQKDPISVISKATHGLGADVVIITAASKSSQPINQAVEFVKPQGKIVVVGDVKLDIARRPFYLKEADLVISRAYGPGRYDADYEKKGLDYPPEKVRWTMKRNMESFLNLLAQKKLQLKPLITHEFHYKEADQAYQTIAKNPSDTLAVVLNYAKQQHQVEIPRHIIEPVKRSERMTKLRTAVIGGSNFAKKQIIPALRRNAKYEIRQLIASNSVNAREIAQSYNIPEMDTRPNEPLRNPEIDLVVIANKHYQHTPLVIEAIKQNKHVFVEKPIALTLADCESLLANCRERTPQVFVDFNRRFAPLSQQLKSAIATESAPLNLYYRVAASGLPLGHWINDPVVGGGRLLGEACHFFDWICWLYDELPVKILAIGDLFRQVGNQIIHRFQVLLSFESGSSATIIYTDLAPRSFPKEHIEIFAGNSAMMLDNFETLTFYEKSARTIRLKKQDKGYDTAYDALADAIIGEKASPITWKDGINATLIGLKAIESIELQQEIEIDWKAFYQE